jgi:hypothetical protein
MLADLAAVERMIEAAQQGIDRIERMSPKRRGVMSMVMVLDGKTQATLRRAGIGRHGGTRGHGQQGMPRHAGVGLRVGAERRAGSQAVQHAATRR